MIPIQIVQLNYSLFNCKPEKLTLSQFFRLILVEVNNKLFSLVAEFCSMNPCNFSFKELSDKIKEAKQKEEESH